MNEIRMVLERIGVSRIGCISGYDDLPIHVYQSCRPGAIQLKIDSGKSWTDKGAWIATAVESIERYAAENVCNETFRCESSLPIRDPRISKSTDCILGVNAIDGSPEYFPREAVEYRLRDPLRLLVMYPMGTTGLGAHTNKDLALVSGLVEVVERLVISRGERYQLRIEDMSEHNKVLFLHMKRKVSDLRCFVYKSDWPISVCSIESNESRVTGGFNSFGLGENTQQAITDCIAEAMQTWLMRIAASRDDWFYAAQYARDTDSLELSLEVAKNVDIESREPNKYSLRVRDDLLESAERQGISIGYVDLQTELSINPINVFKVIAWPASSLRQGAMLTGFPL